MSLSKVILSLVISLSVSACNITDTSSHSDRENVVVIKINNSSDAYTFLKVEQIILENAVGGYLNATVFSDRQNEMQAKELANKIADSYAMKTELVVTDGLAGIQVQLNKYDQAECYVNQLDDFNWYKSSTKEIVNYNQTEICATSINDRLLRI